MTQPPPRKPRFLTSVPGPTSVEAARFGAPKTPPAQLRTIPGEEQKPEIGKPVQHAAGSQIPRQPNFIGASTVGTQHKSTTQALPARPTSPALPAHVSSPGVAKPAENSVPVVPVEMIRERLAAAIDALRSQSEKLAEQARADTLEMAFQIARRIVEVEVRQSPEPLFALIRSSLMQLAAARKITLRVCPGDLEALRGTRGQEATGGLSLAQIEMSADASLEPGECMIDSDLGQIDGRLANRFAELRRQVIESSESVA